MKNFLRLIIFSTGLFCSAAPLVLVNSGKAASTVVIADDAGEVARTAAQELVWHIKKISGADLPVVRESAAPAGTRIFVGNTRAAVKAGLGADKFKNEAWQIKAVNGDLYFSGGENNAPLFYEPMRDKPRKVSYPAWDNNGFHRLTRRGTIYAVVKFLDRELGVRWLWPGELGTVLPKKQTISVPENYSLSGEPAFLWRKYRIGTSVNTYIRGDIRVPKEMYPLMFSPAALETYYKNLRRYLLIQQEGDSIPTPAPASHIDAVAPKLFKKNPGMFAMREDGKRTYYHGQKRLRWCVSSKDVEDYYLKTWNGGEWLGIGEGDTRGFCRCQACMKLDPPQPGYFAGYSTTNRYIDFAKRVRARAMKRNPNVKITILMYMDYIMAPTREKDLSWMYGKFVPYGSGMACNYPMKEKDHRLIMQTWDNWGKTGIMMNYRPNYLLAGYTMPCLDLRQTGEMLRHAAANGMKGFDYDSLRGNWATKGPMLYMHMRLGTDPGMTVDAILKEYYSAFGPAAKQVEAYFNYWINHSAKLGKQGKSFTAADAAPEHFPPECFTVAEKLLDDALKTAQTSPDKVCAERVRFLQTGLRHSKLCVEFSLAFSSNRFADARKKLDEIIAFRRRYEATGFCGLNNIAGVEYRAYPTLPQFIKGEFLHVSDPSFQTKKFVPGSVYRMDKGLRPSKWALSVSKGKKNGSLVMKYDAGKNNHFVKAEFQINARPIKVHNEVAISFDDKNYTVIGKDLAKKRIKLDKYVQGKKVFYLRFNAVRKAESKLSAAEMALFSFRVNYALANPEEKQERPKVDLTGNWQDFNPQWGFRKDIFEKGIPAADMKPATFDLSKWTKVQVPAFLDATPVGPYCGYGFYGAKFKLPPDWAAREVQFLFHAVDEEAWVYINGKLVGEHSEKSEKVGIGILWNEPFIVKVKPEDLRPGKDNVIVVKIRNIKAAGGIYRKIQYRPVDASAYL